MHPDELWQAYRLFTIVETGCLCHRSWPLRDRSVKISRRRINITTEYHFLAETKCLIFFFFKKTYFWITYSICHKMFSKFFRFQVSTTTTRCHTLPFGRSIGHDEYTWLDSLSILSLRYHSRKAMYRLESRCTWHVVITMHRYITINHAIITWNSSPR